MWFNEGKVTDLTLYYSQNATSREQYIFLFDTAAAESNSTTTIITINNTTTTAEHHVATAQRIIIDDADEHTYYTLHWSLPVNLFGLFPLFITF